MFCRFCGKKMQENSAFCRHCGNNQTVMPSAVAADPNACCGSNLKTISRVATVVFYLGVVTFLVLFIKMAPGIGNIRFLTYILGAAVSISLAVLVNKLCAKKNTKGCKVIALMFGLVLLISSIALRIVYEAKVDVVTAAIPGSGSVYVSMTTDEEFYSYVNEGIIHDPSSNIRIGDKWYQERGVFVVELNRPYPMRVGSGYSGNGGYIDTSITFTEENLKNGYTVTKEVPLDDVEFAVVTIQFVRVCGFWEVVFY